MSLCRKRDDRKVYKMTKIDIFSGFLGAGKTTLIKSIVGIHDFDEGDILWTFMLIRQFASISNLSSSLKQITNKRRAFLSEKRKDSIITRHSIRMYVHNLMQTAAKPCEEFIKSAIDDMELYEGEDEE